MKIIDALCFVGQGRYRRQSAEGLLAAMDANGVEKAVLCPVEEQVTVDNAAGNQLVLELCARHPGRFYGYAVANPWFGQKAVDTLKAALDAGLNAVYFDSSIQGFTISDELVDPLIEVCQAYGVPAYFHTGTPAFALPLQLRYLALRHPKVNFIMGHMGANDFISDVGPAMYQLDNLYLETSMNLTCTLEDMLAKYPQRVLFGSAAPRSEQEYELFKLRATAAGADTLENACAANLEQIVGGKL